MKRFSLGPQSHAVTRTSHPSTTIVDQGTFHYTPEMRFFSPVHYTAGYAYPLLVYLHGSGNNVGEMAQIIRLISPRNYVAVGIGGNRSLDTAGTRFDWNFTAGGTERASQSVRGAIDAARSRYNIHPDRVILVGRDQGGSMALKLALADAQQCAAVVSIGGHMPELSLPDWNATRQRGLPIRWQWGKGNPDYTQSSIQRDCKTALSNGAKVDIGQYPGDDEMDTIVFRDIDRWIMDTVAGRTTISDESPSHRVACSLN